MDAETRFEATCGRRRDDQTGRSRSWVGHGGWGIGDILAKARRALPANRFELGGHGNLASVLRTLARPTFAPEKSRRIAHNQIELLAHGLQHRWEQ